MKYKCQVCGHIFESAERVFECPQCGKTEIKETGSFFAKYKNQIVIASVLLGVIFLLLLCSGSNKTNVTATYNKNTRKLEVSLEGKQTDQYNIIVKRDGEPYPLKRYKNKSVSFTFETPGTYTLDVRYTGNEKMPQISSYNKGPWIVTSPPPPLVAPQYSDRIILDKNVKTKKYRISIITDSTIVPISDTEYSIDGQKFQSSSVFSNLSPGEYTYFFRNTKDKSLINDRKDKLPDINSAPSPSDDVLNTLLRQMANGNTTAFKNWRDKVDEGLTIPVTGVPNIDNSYALAQDARQGNSYTVYTQRDNSNRIIKIIVK